MPTPVPLPIRLFGNSRGGDGLAPERLSLIAAKTGEIPCVLAAHWHYL